MRKSLMLGKKKVTKRTNLSPKNCGVGGKAVSVKDKIVPEYSREGKMYPHPTKSISKWVEGVLLPVFTSDRARVSADMVSMTQIASVVWRYNRIAIF